MNEIWLKYEFVWTCRAKPWKTSKSNGWDRKGLTDKQIKTVALLACPLQIAFRDRGNEDSHWIEPIWTQQGVRTIYVGSADVEICCWSDLPSTTDSIFRILWSSQAGSKQGRSLDWWSNSSGVALAAARSFQNCQSQTCRFSAEQVAYAPCSSWSPERHLLKSEQRWSMISNPLASRKHHHFLNQHGHFKWGFSLLLKWQGHLGGKFPILRHTTCLYSYSRYIKSQGL